MTLTPSAHARQHSAAVDYYGHDDVRARIREYCGGTAFRPPTAAFVLAFDGDARALPTWDNATRLPADRLEAVWARGDDISRSLWDTERLLFFFELEYQNIDHPGEPFVHPADVFLKLEPAYQAFASSAAARHLRTRSLVSGRGYHFVGQVPLSDPIVDRLAALVPDTPGWYWSHEARRPEGSTARMSERQARAASGLGLLLEYLAHLVHETATASSVIPVVFNGTVVGRGVYGRECASIDFSHAGDPLDVRHMRTAFSTYQWHRHRPDIFGADVALGVPPLVVLPRGRHSLMMLLAGGRDLEAGARAARESSVLLPNVAQGLTRLLDDYSGSTLAAFHREFLAERHATGTGVRPLDPADVPPCMAAALVRPNDLLLKPEFLQHLVRGLLSRGWTAGEIAALVQSKYEADFGWGDRWMHMHPATRAEFEVRVFAGLIATGRDSLIDFNCVSAQEKDLCPRTRCTHDLRLDRDRLVAGASS